VAGQQQLAHIGDVTTTAAGRTSAGLFNRVRANGPSLATLKLRLLEVALILAAFEAVGFMADTSSSPVSAATQTGGAEKN